MSRGKGLMAALALLLCAALLPGCQTQGGETARQVFAMDTVMTLTIPEGGTQVSTQEALDFAEGQIHAIERQLSVTREGSDIHTINTASGHPVKAEASTIQLLTEALALCRQTGGALDVTAYPAVTAWGFTTGSYRVPTQEELDELAAGIDHTLVTLTDTTVHIPQGMQLDLGAVTKGYTGDVLSQQLQAQGVSSALLDLGQSSIQAIGSKPDGSPWRIGIQDPAGTSYLGVLELSGMAMGTSGGYQRYFEADGVRYWHILDPDTAAPARSGLASVTVVSPSGLTCDGLSTALFVMGLEEGSAFWRTHPELDFDAIFITDDGGIFLTAGLEAHFSLAEGYEDREVVIFT